MAEPTRKEQDETEVITNAVQFWKKIFDEKEVVIRFIKLDKSVRIMRCTLDFTKIPQEHKPSTVDIKRILELIQKSKIMRVYDLDKQGWRSVPFERVEWMDTKNMRYIISKKKH